MIATILLASTLTTQPIIKEGMTERERLEAIRPFLTPAPGNLVKVDPEALEEKRFNHKPMLYKLYVTIKPPPGSCFTITRNPAIEDQRVCEETRLAIPVGEISEAGQFSWTISTGEGDFGHVYTWNTPHRIAQKILAGTNAVVHVPVFSCEAQPNAAGKRIILNLMDGERWAVTFPEQDVPEENQPPPMPNLYVAQNIPAGGITKDSSVKSSPADPWAHLKTVKPGDPVTAHWAIPPRDHYTMSASNFKITDTAPGMTGKCRYKYSGATKDPESGWIECHEIDLYDVIFTHLTCSSSLTIPTTD